MDRIKNIILFLLPILFFALITLYFIQVQKIKSEERQRTMQVRLDSIKMERIYTYILNCGNATIIPLNKQMMVADSNHKYIKIGKLINKRKFVFHFDETNCFTCVEKYLPFLKKLAARVGKENVMILGSFEKEENLFLTLRGYDLQNIAVYNLNPSYLKNTVTLPKNRTV